MGFEAPDQFSRAFSLAWGSRDVAGLAAMFAEDADLLTLTGAWAEGRQAIADVLAGELAGAFARARLVTGRTKLRRVGAEGAVLMQRFVLSGIRHADGSDAGRVGAVLSAVMAPREAGWQVVSASFTVEG
ncbi:MAG: SgcJ/EcaC family oxidoreductase [Defluviimonas sp.]|nr:SgcJ/EcaC family oxidoreductase [Defluviimonas sp.]